MVSPRWLWRRTTAQVGGCVNSAIISNEWNLAFMVGWQGVCPMACNIQPELQWFGLQHCSVASHPKYVDQTLKSHKKYIFKIVLAVSFCKRRWLGILLERAALSLFSYSAKSHPKMAYRVAPATSISSTGPPLLAFFLPSKYCESRFPKADRIPLKEWRTDHTLLSMCNKKFHNLKVKKIKLCNFWVGGFHGRYWLANATVCSVQTKWSGTNTSNSHK